MGKGKQTSTQTTSSEPWSAAQPLLRKGIDEASRLYDAGTLTAAPYAGPRVAAQSGDTLSGLGLLSGVAQNNPVTGAATNAYTGMLNADPYRDLDLVKQQALESVLPGMRSLFSNSGMLNSSIAGDQITGAAMRAVAPIDYGAYENAQNRKLNLLGMAPQMQGMQYGDAQALLGAGAMQDDYAQRALDSQIGAYYEGADLPYTNLQRITGIGMGYGGLGGTSSGTATQSRSPGILGILGPLAQIGSFF